MTSNKKSWLLLPTLLLTALPCAFAAGGAVADEFKWMTFLVFGGIIAVTMYITYWAARSTPKP